jgi:hypothetical protein
LESSPVGNIESKGVKSPKLKVEREEEGKRQRGDALMGLGQAGGL